MWRRSCEGLLVAAPPLEWKYKLAPAMSRDQSLGIVEVPSTTTNKDNDLINK